MESRVAPGSSLAYLQGDEAAGADWAEVLDSVVGLLHDAHEHFHWTGIYLVEGDELVLGPYRGQTTEHERIRVGEGICGAAAQQGATIVVDDVRADPRYLACFVSTRSEIVVPIFAGGRSDGQVVGEIDVDSDLPAAFGDGDRQLLESVAARLGELAARHAREGGQ